MNKAFYIIGIVFSVIFLILGAYYAEEVQSAKWDSIFNYSGYDYGYTNYSSYSYSSSYKDLSVEASLWSLVFFLFFIASDLLGLIKIKTRTAKVISIIGLSFSGIFLLWNFAVLFSDGGISFDEVYPGWLLYCLIMLAFSIIGLIQSVRFSRGGRPSPVAVNSENKDLLDS